MGPFSPAVLKGKFHGVTQGGRTCGIRSQARLFTGAHSVVDRAGWRLRGSVAQAVAELVPLQRPTLGLGLSRDWLCLRSGDRLVCGEAFCGPGLLPVRVSSGTGAGRAEGRPSSLWEGTSSSFRLIPVASEGT